MKCALHVPHQSHASYMLLTKLNFESRLWGENKTHVSSAMISRSQPIPFLLENDGDKSCYCVFVIQTQN